jgi:hypothetical protein
MAAPPARTLPLRLAIAFIAASLATGFGWLAALPPLEGFDETAHFSYIQQLADTRTIPVFGGSYLSRDVRAYTERLPTPYGNVPPFEANGGITYQDFFAAPPSVEALAALHAARRFAPSEEPNWQAQHPPLYYALLAPLYAATRDWSWPAQFFLLRAVSWTMAMAGFILGVCATYRYWRGEKDAADAAAVAAAWPFLVPMFFPEMARLGNDSLCLLLAGAMWWMVAQTGANDVRWRTYVALGGLLGLGLLTKAFFLPITAGVALWLAFGRRWRGLAVTVTVAAVIGAPWYVYKFVAYGVATGAHEQILLAEQGGLLKGLTERFSLGALVRGTAAVVATFSWAGTWSLARLPETFLVPLVTLLVLPLGAYAVRLVRKHPSEIDWAPFFIVGMVAAGLGHHVLVRIALSGEGIGTPGWYLHMLVGPLGFAYAFGALTLTRYYAARMLAPVLAAYAIGYFAIATWMQLAMYSGCIAKIGTNKHYALPHDASCLTDVPSTVARLGILAEPAIALPLLAGGIGLGAVSLGILCMRLARP